MQGLLLSFEKAIDSIPLDPENGFTGAGDYLYTVFGAFNLNFETKDSVLELMDSVAETLTEGKV